MDKDMFLLNLNPQDNHYYKYGLIVNPFPDCKYEDLEDYYLQQYRRALKEGVPHDRVDEIAVRAGFSREVGELLKRHTEPGKKYIVTIKDMKLSIEEKAWIVDIHPNTENEDE
jgi:hypothetical protein